VQLHKLLEILTGDRALVLQAELEFLAVHCQRLMNTLKALESHEFHFVDIFNTTSGCVTLVSQLQPGHVKQQQQMLQQS